MQAAAVAAAASLAAPRACAAQLRLNDKAATAAGPALQLSAATVAAQQHWHRPGALHRCGSVAGAVAASAAAAAAAVAADAAAGASAVSDDLHLGGLDAVQH